MEGQRGWSRPWQISLGEGGRLSNKAALGSDPTCALSEQEARSQQHLPPWVAVRIQ